MIVRDVHTVLEEWAPQELAWERDNVGLQVGSMNRRVRRILVALDVTDEVLREAIGKKIDLIVTHHPLLFHPARSVTPEDRVGRLVYLLAQSGIALYSAHTNLDFTSGGVSVALAERLGLQHLDVLEKDQSVMKKIVVFVPPDHVDPVMAAMAAAGAGTIGRYEMCSFRTPGTGSYKPSAGAKPFTGKIGRLENVDELRLEMVVPRWKLAGVVGAMRRAHPYEEVAYDVYDLANGGDAFGSGVIGELPKEMQLADFLRLVEQRLQASGIRFAGRLRRTIKRVAACGGSGSNFLPVAIRRGADAFVTADVSYHAFQECDNRIALIDAGHFETEQPVVPRIVAHLKSRLGSRRDRVQVFPSSRTKNFVQYYMP